MNKKNKKIKHLWSLICGSTVVDKVSNNISLFNVTERLNISFNKDDITRIRQKDISIPINFEVVNQFEILSEIKNFEVRLDLLDPSGVCLTTTEHKIEMPNKNNAKNIRFIVKISKIKITSSGKYHISVSVREPNEKEFEEVYKIPLSVDILLK